MLRTFVRSLSLVAILAGAAAAAGDPLPVESTAKVETGNGEATKVETKKPVKKKSLRKAKKKAARKNLKKKSKKSKKAVKAAKAAAPAERRPVP